jgi:predicted DNA-binding transcriptional regulator AlpA
MPEQVRYLSANQVAERIGVKPSTLTRYKLPPADAITGPVNDDGSLPRGTTRGWLPATIEEWNAHRPGQGARTDLKAGEQ